MDAGIFYGGASTEAVRTRYPPESEAIPIVGFQATLGAAYQQQFWSFDIKPARRREAARAFARSILSADDVLEIWLLDSRGDLDVAVVVSDLVLERELWLRGAFVDAVCAQLDSGEGELSVFSSDRVPGWVREGKRISA